LDWRPGFEFIWRRTGIVGASGIESKALFAMKTRQIGLLFLFCCLLSSFAGNALSAVPALPGFTGSDSVVRVSSEWSHTGARPGDQITLAVVLDITEPYHINAHNAREPFIPTTIELANAPGVLRSSTPVFPQPHDLEFGAGAAKEQIPVFSERTVIYIPMSITSGAKPGELELELQVGYQACDDRQCLFPSDVVIKPKLIVLDSGAEPARINEELFAGLDGMRQGLNLAFFGWDFRIEPSKLWLLLFVAALGGLLLNLTPCVLPVIPIKIIGLSRAAGDRKRCFVLGSAMAVGVVAFWLGLGLAISTISGFNATNKLFQYPAFTITVGVIICVMAVGMCGLFSVGLPQWVYRINPSHESTGGSFLFGIMTAILSTPCTAPFMGAAAAWAATQSAAVTLATFAAIGGGMAMPYLVLSAFPSMVNRMPRTGPASELIKQVMGLLLLAAGAYFLGTGLAGVLATPPDPPTQLYWWVVAFFIAGAGLWLTWRTFQITKSAGRRIFFGGLGVLLILVAVGIGQRFTQSSPVRWVYYTPERLAEAQGRKQVVVLEFTAAWCLNCHALEQAVLHHPRIVEMLNSSDVTPIKVDITGNNPVGNQKLVEVGRRTIPYLVIYSPSGEMIFESDAYTVEQVSTAITRARAAASGAETRLQ
jgi:thiol:disulfide interchange protein